MKKLITTTLIIIFLVNTAMSQVFDGIKISGDFNSTLEKFKSKVLKKIFVFSSFYLSF